MHQWIVEEFAVHDMLADAADDAFSACNLIYLSFII
jgi:hypothetical protein